MAEERSTEQMKMFCIEKMGPELGSVFNALRNELVWLHVKWHQYRELFGEKPERIDLMNDAAPLFFRIIQDSLWEDTLLNLARLTDRPETGGKDRQNLTVRALPALIEETGLRNETGLLVTKAQATTAFAVDWRNRHIAHRDLRLALEEPLIELAPASRLQVRQALEALVRVLNKVEGHFLGGETAYDIGGDPGDAVSMLYLLRGGVEAEAARRARMSKGEPLESDSPTRNLSGANRGADPGRWSVVLLVIPRERPGPEAVS